MIITVGSIKGGVGKSTIATNLAAQYANEGVKTTLVDADFQLTSSNWWHDRQGDSHPQVKLLSIHEDLREDLAALDSKDSVIIVDCQGKDGKELRSALTVSEIFITPVRPSQADIDTLFTLDGIIDWASSLNNSLITLGVLSIAPVGKRSEGEILSAREAIAEYQGIKCLDTVLFDRKAYRDALGTGLGVCELKGPRLLAPTEFLSFVNEVKCYGR